jgi:Fe-S oxidoreductase
MRIGLFVPCYIDAFLPKVGIATLELLERFGHDVDYPRNQTCCGQPRRTGRALAFRPANCAQLATQPTAVQPTQTEEKSYDTHCKHSVS